jgi:hypothetical protein
LLEGPLFGQVKVLFNHLLNEFIEGNAMFPSKLAPRFPSVTNKIVYLGRTEISGVYLDEHTPSTASTPRSDSPVPCHTILRPVHAKAFSTNSLTE